ncbi:MAG: tail fiber domain-containing protein [Saprospiraceae bacterium]|nr:tail fiber domain-containing protein [Saprospiraceae bacterium]
MKPNTFSTTALLAIAVFCCNTLFAQWTVNNTAIWTTNLNLNVGVGTSTPTNAKLQFDNGLGNKITLFQRSATEAYGLGMNHDNISVYLPSGSRFSVRNNSHSGAEKFVVNYDGKVGIGTTSPAANLHVNGAENNGSASAIRIVSGTQVMILDGNEMDALTDALYLNHNSNKNVFVGTGGGNVRIGSWINPTTKLDVGGDVRCFNIFTNSDRRYKTGIKTLESALDKILAMRGTSYDFAVGQIPADYTAGKQVGFIAQEMQAVMPELVKVDAEGMMSVNYIGVIPVLVEALKEQHEAVAEKETRIAALEAKNAELQDRLARIEAALGMSATDRQESPAAVTATISPNPSAGIVTVSLTNTASAKSVTMKILDSTGREIANRSAAGVSSVQFDLSQYPSGVYVAQVVADGKMVSTNKVQLVK